MIQPPSVGPRLGPIIAPTPKIAWPMPCCRAGKVSTMIAWDVDEQRAAAEPLDHAPEHQRVRRTARAPHISDANVKSRIET